MKKTVLVTGGAGFIGSHLVDALISRGHKVIVLDNLSTGKQENINPKAIFFRCDVNGGLPNIQEPIDWVFHLAATVGVKRTIENPLAVLNDVHGIFNVLEFAKFTNAERVIFSSSSEVYGNPVEFPEREDGHVNPQMPYAVVKLFGEKMLRAYYDMFGLKTTSLRFFNVYGPRQEGSEYGFVTGVFINQLLNKKPITIFGDGSQTRDFVFVKDNVQAMLDVVESDHCAGEVINIGNGRPISIYDLAMNIMKLSGTTIPPIYLPDRPQEIRHRFPDTSKMRKLLTFKPGYSLEEGLFETWNYYLKLYKYEKKFVSDDDYVSKMEK